MRAAFVMAAFALLLVPPASAAMYGEGFAPCGDQSSTVATVDCIAAKTNAWDIRLNAAYRKLGTRIDADQRAPLTAAQRLWVQYRDANCRFYAARDGSIRQVEAAECLRAMTEARTLELEQAMSEP